MMEEIEEVICPICDEPMIDHTDLWVDAFGDFHWEHISKEEEIDSLTFD